MSPEISALKRDEASELEELLTVAFGEETRLMARADIDNALSDHIYRHHFIVTRIDKKIVGVSAISEEMFSSKTWGISWVAVHPDYRRQGIGQKLVLSCLDKIAEQIAHPVTALLSTYPGKTGLYDRLGFKGS